MSTSSANKRPHPKLDAEFLAKQLPQFQEKLATAQKQDSLKFATNAPADLPCPPLFPGEVVELQQHRVMCVDCFPEAAVGVLYLTNYRLIFIGNSISDPESYEVVRDIHQSCSRREMVVPDISKPHFFLARTPSAPVETFTSHVLNLPNEIPEELSEHSPSPSPAKGSTRYAAAAANKDSLVASSPDDMSRNSPSLFNRFQNSVRYIYRGTKRAANTSPGPSSARAIIAKRIGGATPKKVPRKTQDPVDNSQPKRNGALFYDDAVSFDSVSVGSDVASSNTSPCGSPNHSRAAGWVATAVSVGHQDGHGHPLSNSKNRVTAVGSVTKGGPQTHGAPTVANGTELADITDRGGGEDIAGHTAHLADNALEVEKPVDFEKSFEMPSSLRRHQLGKGEWYRRKGVALQLESDSDTDDQLTDADHDKPASQQGSPVASFQPDEPALQTGHVEDEGMLLHTADLKTNPAHGSAQVTIIETSEEHSTDVPLQQEGPAAVSVQLEVLTAAQGQQEVPASVQGQQEIPADVQDQQEIPEGLQSQPEIIASVQGQQEVPADVQDQQEIPEGLQSQPKVTASVQGQQEVPAGVQGQQEVPAGVQGQQEVPAGVQGQQEVPAGVQGQQEVPAGVQGQQEVPAGVQGQQEVPAGVQGQQEVPAGVQGQQEVPAGVQGQQEVPAGVQGQQEVPAGVQGQQEVPAGVQGQQEVPAGVQGQQEVPAGVQGQQEVSAGVQGQQEVPAGVQGQQEVPAGIQGQQEVPVQGQQEVPAGVQGQQEVPAGVQEVQAAVPSNSALNIHAIPQPDALQSRAITKPTPSKQSNGGDQGTDARSQVRTVPSKPPTKPKPMLQPGLLQSKQTHRPFSTSSPLSSLPVSPLSPLPMKGEVTRPGTSPVIWEEGSPAHSVASDSAPCVKYQDVKTTPHCHGIPLGEPPGIPSESMMLSENGSLVQASVVTEVAASSPSSPNTLPRPLQSAETPLIAAEHTLLHGASSVVAEHTLLHGASSVVEEHTLLHGASSVVAEHTLLHGASSVVAEHTLLHGASSVVEEHTLLHGASSVVEEHTFLATENHSPAPSLAGDCTPPPSLAAENTQSGDMEPCISISLTVSTEVTQLDTDHGPSLDTDHGPSLDTCHGPSLDTDHGPSLDTDHGPSLDTDHGPSLDTCHGPSLDTDHGPSLDTDHGPSLDTDHGPSLDTDHGPSLDTDHGPSLDTDHGPSLDTDHGPSLDTESSIMYLAAELPLSGAVLSLPRPLENLTLDPPSELTSSPGPAEDVSSPGPHASPTSSLTLSAEPSSPSQLADIPSSPSPSESCIYPGQENFDSTPPLSIPSGAHLEPSIATPPHGATNPFPAPVKANSYSSVPLKTHSSSPAPLKTHSSSPALFRLETNSSTTSFEGCSSSPASSETLVSAISPPKPLPPPPPVPPPRKKRASAKYKTLPSIGRAQKESPMSDSSTSSPNASLQLRGLDADGYTFDDVRDLLVSDGTLPISLRDVMPTSGSPSLPHASSFGSSVDTLSTAPLDPSPALPRPHRPSVDALSTTSSECTDTHPRCLAPPSSPKGPDRPPEISRFSTLRPRASGMGGSGGGRGRGGGFHSPQGAGRKVSNTWSPKGSRRHDVMSHGSQYYAWTIDIPLPTILLLRKIPAFTIRELEIKLSDGLLVLCKNFHSMRLFIHSQNTYDSDRLKDVIEKCFLTEKALSFAYQYRSSIKMVYPTFPNSTTLPNFFKLSNEITRWGLCDSNCWAVRTPFKDNPDVCPTYPEELIMPASISDQDIIQGAGLYNNGRIPTLCWYSKELGVALLRGADNITARGQAGPNLHMDEALLQAIASSNGNTTGEVNTGQNRLCIFTEKRSELFSSLPPDQVKTYYYHCCTFEYTENPTFRSVRHSFNRLQAMLENDLSDDLYLIALNETQWLARVSELLHTSTKVCEVLVARRSNVLVCYESGWDRTTQIVSLAQLLVDPYYRTMDGFQVLVQKEWLWFGHPFKSRHFSLNKDKDKEDSAIFLQWVDCIWQVMEQCPSAFEFNEQFLMELVNFSYSSRTGTFLANCQKERNMPIQNKGCEHMTLTSHTVNLWLLIAMKNATNRDLFYNKLYSSKVYPGVITPRYNVPFLKLWLSYYRLHKVEEQSQPVSLLRTQLKQLLETCIRLQGEAEKAAMDSSCAIQKLPELSKPQVKSTGNGSALGAADKGAHKTIEHQLQEAGFDTSICKHIKFGLNICEGELIKQGGIARTWLRRWFVLDFVRECLVYFESLEACRNQNPPKGVIALKNVKRAYQNVDSRTHLVRNIFCLETMERTYLMRAPSLQTMEIWIGSLQLALKKVHSASH